MSTNSNVFTLSLTSPQAACIGAWLEKHNLLGIDRAPSPTLDAFAWQLDDASWIGRWLREETRVSIAWSDCIAICEAVREALKHTPTSPQEKLALDQLIAELERASSRHSPQSTRNPTRSLVGTGIEQ